MSSIVPILFGAALTVAFCWAAGRLLLTRLRIELCRVEQHLIAFVVGSAVVSLFVFCLCLAGGARRGVLQWTAAGFFALALWRERFHPRARPLPRLGAGWLIAFTVIVTPFFFNYFIHALAPEVSPDGAGYHLGNVNRILQARGFAWDHHNMYSYLSQGMEMLFLVAFAIGRHSASALVHLAFQTVLPLLLICFGLRTNHARAGIFAAVVVYASPVIGMDGSIAYNDVALATILLVIVYLLKVSDDNFDIKLLFVIGLLCGFAYAVKYTAGLAMVFAAGWAAWQSRYKGALAPAIAVAAGSAITAAPWILRNWIWLGNPAAPFLNRWFPNPYYHPGMEEIYREGLRHYEGISHLWQIPLNLTIHGGGNVGGLVGPVFLLAPLALLALRYPLGRRLLAAAAVFALPALLNVGSRFLIPALPFLAMALGMAIENSPGVLPVLAIFHAVLCLPAVLPLYCHPHAWRLSRQPPIEAALRRIPEKEYIHSHSGDVELAPLIEHVAPAGQKIFSFAGRPESYINREILVSYESTLANFANDVLLAPIDGFKPTVHQRWKWQPRPLTAIRIVQTATAPSFWTMSEVRVFRDANEMARDREWRLSSRPNGWEVQLAFDNNPVTRWSSWEASRPGQFVEIRFPHPETPDSVVVESAGEGHSRLRLEGQGSDGRWVELAPSPERVEVPPPRGMRLAATHELKARGIGFLLVQDSDFFYDDVAKYSPYWGVTRLGAAGGAHFYRID
jgi:hypothetical protein